MTTSLPLDPDAPEELPEPTAAVAAVVALGGAVGGGLRVGVNALLPAQPGGFPWATFAENVTGAFVLGFVVVLIVQLLPGSRYWRPFLATGVLGGYTTFSALANELREQLQVGDARIAAAYLAATLAVGIGASILGVWLGGVVVRGRRGAL